jgi:DNA-binding NarL/FixJ family response regulator
MIQVSSREQQVAALLIQGCDNAEIAKRLKIALRTVKAHMNRMFMRYGIKGGIKRVKLATLLYRRELELYVNSATDPGPSDPASTA